MQYAQSKTISRTFFIILNENRLKLAKPISLYLTKKKDNELTQLP